jgi:DNA-binding NarL/FixJ family response regulator
VLENDAVDCCILINERAPEMRARIFVIEDESIAVKNIISILTEEGYEIAGVVSDCKQAVKLINESQVDLIVCNLYLKFTFCGDDIIQLIRSVRKIPFIFLSSFTHDDRLNTILRTKSEIYLSSPYTREQLLDSVKRLIRNFYHQKNTYFSPLIVI